MSADSTIFDRPFKPRTDLEPTRKDLEAFLDGETTPGGLPHKRELAPYRRLLDSVDAFGLDTRQGKEQDPRDIMFHAVVGGQFANHALLEAVELYKYQRHAVESLEFARLLQFIKNAELEMSKLNKNKIDHVLRMVRLQEMVAERKKLAAGQKQRWLDLTAELRRIALYITDNLIRLAKKAGAAAAVLAAPETEQTKEKQLLDELAVSYKLKVKEALKAGKISAHHDLENVKKGLETLSAEIAGVVRDDCAALTKLYGALHAHVQKTVEEVVVLVEELDAKKGGGVEENLKLLKQVEQAFVALLTEYRLEPVPLKIKIDPVRAPLIMQRRRQMLDYLLEQARSGGSDRRARKDRRKSEDPNYKGPERRKGRDRRGQG